MSNRVLDQACIISVFEENTRPGHLVAQRNDAPRLGQSPAKRVKIFGSQVRNQPFFAERIHYLPARRVVVVPSPLDNLAGVN